MKYGYLFRYLISDVGKSSGEREREQMERLLVIGEADVSTWTV